MESERIRAVTDFTRDLAVDASAGTGKTATLIARVTNLFLLRKELLPDQVLLLTFTEKAAAEMKSRVVEGWELLLAACRSVGTFEEAEGKLLSWNPLVRIPRDIYPSLADLRSRSVEMADGVGRLSVTTFHSFCARVLLSFPAEARVDPKFEVLPENASSDAWDGAFRKFLRAEFGGEETDPAWELVLSRSSSQEAVFAMIRRLCLSQRDLLLSGSLDFGTPSDFLDHLGREYSGAVEWFQAFAAGIGDPEHEMAPVLRRANETLGRAWDAVSRGDLDAASAAAEEGAAAMAFNANLTRSRKAFPQPPGHTPAGARDLLLEFFRELREAPQGDAAARFLVDRARIAARLYEEAKGSGLDFMDLLLRANALLLGNGSVAARLSQRFRYIFVDEFQDTDPLQAGMLRALSSDGAPGRLFLVGDPKQSIYGFRRADIQVYHRFREELLSRTGDGLALVRNFRSRPDLIRTTNGLFGRVLSGRGDFSPPYVPVFPDRQDEGAGPPATLFSMGEGVPEPEFLCGLIRRILETVRVGGKGGAPERAAVYRDIAVLYRSDTGGEVLSSYRKALVSAGIPHVVPQRKGFYTRQEVQDLRMVLSAVDEPADRSARYAALKTLFFGLGDGEILPLYASGKEAASPRVRDALGVLRRLSARRGRTSLPDLLAELYREAGVDFVAARLAEGERILQNLAKALDMARAFEWRGGGSLKAFLAEIRRRTEEDREENEFPSFDEGENAVSLSTIHASKGLEFPVVILANLSRGGKKPLEGLRVDRVRGLAAVIFPGFKTYSAYRLVRLDGDSIPFEQWEREKQAAEEKRLLYVAATRARDRLLLVEGAKGRGSELQGALREGLSGSTDGGEGRCAVTGLAGRRRVFPGGGELLQAAVPVLPPLDVSPEAHPPDLSLPRDWSPPPIEPSPPAPEPVSLKEFHDRARGRQFGDKVHRALEAAPPVAAGWPPPAPAPVLWGEGEAARWEAIRGRIAASPFFRELCETALVGTEVPLVACRGGWAEEDRADLVVRSSRECWVVDYKTGRRERASEDLYAVQVRNYMAILADAWKAPVRGFIWYVETGEAVEVN
ncbi:MAG: UvrD-helicase domain-containing protein [Deltaproteobacteria bacterium]|nr:UvrD-helicase domain-containing protein [Deltaproteobacteria bacterium]